MSFLPIVHWPELVTNPYLNARESGNVVSLCSQEEKGMEFGAHIA
jgi:hypothetical protein